MYIDHILTNSHPSGQEMTHAFLYRLDLQKDDYNKDYHNSKEVETLS